jgi:hypothetical protein
VCWGCLKLSDGGSGGEHGVVGKQVAELRYRGGG